MSGLSSPIPFISISPPPEEDPIVEPFSPFSALPAPSTDQDAFRPSHLTPPATITSFKRALSPLHPSPAVGQGLESQRFQMLLAASRQRKAYAGSDQSVNFRKEIAMRAHKNADRRALFLSKLQAPPSPTISKPPPESPEIFHHSFPSPGLESSLTLFESWSGNHADDVPQTWVEHADLGLLDDQSKPNPSLNRSSTKPACGIPSLDQISARFSRPAKRDDIKTTCDALTNKDSPRLSVGIGRLRMPLRTRAVLQSDNQQQKGTRSKTLPPLLSLEPCVKIHDTPRSPPSIPAHLAVSDLNSRDQKASNMLFTLRRRKLSSESTLTRSTTATDQETADSEEEALSKLKWRRSAPADMTPLRARFGFEHPVLASPGGF